MPEHYSGACDYASVPHATATLQVHDMPGRLHHDDVGCVKRAR
jgi:hypothetical protein